MEESATSLHASSSSSTAAAAAARTTESEARARTSALEAEAASLRAKFFSLSSGTQQSMDTTSDSDTELSPPHLPRRAPQPHEELDPEMEDDTGDFLGDIDRTLDAREREMEVDSFLDEMDYSQAHPKSPRNYAAGSTTTTTTTNYGRGGASFLVKTGQGALIETRTTHTQIGGVAQGEEALAAATTKFPHSSTATGGSSMSIDEEEEKEEEESDKVDRQGVTSSGDTTMSSSGKVVIQPPHPPPPPPPPPPTQ